MLEDNYGLGGIGCGLFNRCIGNYGRL